MSGWTFPLSCGVEVTEAALNIAVGLPPGDLQPRFSAVSAERAFISIPGRIQALEGLPEVRQVDGLQELFLRVRVGERVRLPVNNLEKCGNVITRGAHPRAGRRRRRPGPSAGFPAPGARRRGDPGFPARPPAPGPGPPFPGSAKRWARPWRGCRKRWGSLAPLRLGAEGAAVLRPEGLKAEPACDWHGLSLAGALEQVERLTRVPSADAPMPGRLTLGRVFWEALRRGGVQAGVYLIETLCAGDPAEILGSLRPGGARMRRMAFLGAVGRLLLLAAGGARGEELQAVLRELDATLIWDPLTGQGQFELSGKQLGEPGDRIAFRVGFPWALVNYRYLVCLAGHHPHGGRAGVLPAGTGELAQALPGRTAARGAAARGGDPDRPGPRGHGFRRGGQLRGGPGDPPPRGEGRRAVSVPRAARAAGRRVPRPQDPADPLRGRVPEAGGQGGHWPTPCPWASTRR